MMKKVLRLGRYGNSRTKHFRTNYPLCKFLYIIQFLYCLFTDISFSLYHPLFYFNLLSLVLILVICLSWSFTTIWSCSIFPYLSFIHASRFNRVSTERATSSWWGQATSTALLSGLPCQITLWPVDKVELYYQYNISKFVLYIFLRMTQRALLLLASFHVFLRKEQIFSFETWGQCTV